MELSSSGRAPTQQLGDRPSKGILTGASKSKDEIILENIDRRLLRSLTPQRPEERKTTAGRNRPGDFEPDNDDEAGSEVFRAVKIDHRSSVISAGSPKRQGSCPVLQTSTVTDGYRVETQTHSAWLGNSKTSRGSPIRHVHEHHHFHRSPPDVKQNYAARRASYYSTERVVKFYTTSSSPVSSPCASPRSPPTSLPLRSSPVHSPHQKETSRRTLADNKSTKNNPSAPQPMKPRRNLYRGKVGGSSLGTSSDSRNSYRKPEVLGSEGGKLAPKLAGRECRDFKGEEGEHGNTGTRSGDSKRTERGILVSKRALMGLADAYEELLRINHWIRANPPPSLPPDARHSPRRSISPLSPDATSTWSSSSHRFFEPSSSSTGAEDLDGGDEEEADEDDVVRRVEARMKLLEGMLKKLSRKAKRVVKNATPSKALRH
mmetsp:Transcript_2595/g.5130  ORF Transcript_2595/g.5130 Transcript_2595/m.5130 type:complete len:431 (+) Transcript_2595:38-1330(+)